MLIQPKCVTVENVTFLNNLDYCYEDFPIRIRHNDVTVFLRTEQFIVNTSKKLDCAISRKLINFNDTLVVQMVGNKIMYLPIQERSIYTFEPTRIEHEDIDFNHHPVLTRNFDYFTQHEKIESVVDKGNTFQVLADVIPPRNNTIYEFAGETFNSFADYRHKVATWITIAITKICMVIALITLTCYLCRYRNTNRTVRTDLNDLLMRLELLRGVRNSKQMENEQEKEKEKDTKKKILYKRLSSSVHKEKPGENVHESIEIKT
jgi:hypothetical protein